MATLDELEARLAALEARSGAAPSGLSPNYITVDPTTGTISADFSGTINAVGVILPAQGIEANANANAFIWHDPTTNEETAELRGYFLSNYMSQVAIHTQSQQGILTPWGEILLYAESDSNNEAFVYVDAKAHDDANTQVYVKVLNNAAVTLTRKILAADGTSDFLQLANNLSDLPNKATAITNLGGPFAKVSGKLEDVPVDYSTLQHLGALADPRGGGFSGIVGDPLTVYANGASGTMAAGTLYNYITICPAAIGTDPGGRWQGGNYVCRNSGVFMVSGAVSIPASYLNEITVGARNLTSMYRMNMTSLQPQAIASAGASFGPFFIPANAGDSIQPIIMVSQGVSCGSLVNGGVAQWFSCVQVM